MSHFSLCRSGVSSNTSGRPVLGSVAMSGQRSANETQQNTHTHTGRYQLAGREAGLARSAQLICSSTVRGISLPPAAATAISAARTRMQSNEHALLQAMHL
jgi:hypothetical protein